MPLAPNVIHVAPNRSWLGAEGAQDAKRSKRIEGVNWREAQSDPAPLCLEDAQAVRMDALRGDLGRAKMPIVLQQAREEDGFVRDRDRAAQLLDLAQGEVGIR
jgi:hypothetical protein